MTLTEKIRATIPTEDVHSEKRLEWLVAVAALTAEIIWEHANHDIAFAVSGAETMRNEITFQLGKKVQC